MNKQGILCVANWESNVGYAWWLMESFWVKISEEFDGDYDVRLVYPEITTLPESIEKSSLIIDELVFDHGGLYGLIKQLIFIRKHRIRLIYYSDRPYFSFRYAFFKAVGVKKIIVHDHTPGLREKPAGIKKILKSLKSRVPLFNCDVVVGATDFVTQRCVDVACFPSEKCFSAPNGIPAHVDNIGCKSLREKYSINENSIIIVSAGRVTEYKGVGFAIEVIEKMISEGLNIHYIYFGDGPDRRKYEKIIKDRSLVQNITFAGRVDNLQDFLLECDIAFHPSKGEVGYSLSILEYMRAALPVVVPNNPSVCAATRQGETGCIYQDGSVDHALSCLKYLAKKKNLRLKLGKEAKKDFLTHYTIDVCHRNLFDILRKQVNC